ncbi:hypothetical protein EK21DRAFT_107726 [Setomelanomma holmii]|uniref:Uncharacterized protein n=1 Tax=Setomelanomma holmii TaxID=210430 RepID=A0A9P4LQT8_9PLEO|nr:hypothetical protein EK21DRAFT_107726 [Setomelanomma holmii]
MCGHALLPWEHYTKAVKYLVFDNFIEQIDRQADKSLLAIDLRNILRDFIRKQETDRQPLSTDNQEDDIDPRIVFLSSCLTDVSQLQATNPKDKMYGLQALYTTFGIPLPDVDYGKSLAKVYEGAAVAMISWSGTLRILGDACRTDGDAQIPSWVPD